VTFYKLFIAAAFTAADSDLCNELSPTSLYRRAQILCWRLPNSSVRLGYKSTSIDIWSLTVDSNSAVGHPLPLYWQTINPYTTYSCHDNLVQQKF